MFKASINSFIVLCIINSVFISVPKLNDDSNAFISDYCISITNENKYVKKALELLAVYQDSTLCNITSFKINNYQVDTQIFDVLFAEKTFKSLRKDVEILSDVSIKIYETIDNFENIDLNKIKYIVDKLTSVENIDNIAVILITILFSYESYLDEIDDSIKTYYQSINYQNELETISNLLDIVKQYKVNYKKEYLKEISIKLYSLKSINLLGYFSCCYLFNTYFKDQSKLINIKEKIASYAINNKFNEDILLVDELYLYFLDLADIKNISTFLYVCMKSNFVNYIL